MATPIDGIVNAEAPLESGRTAASEADRAKVRSLAEQFEAMLLSQMLREMRESMAEDDTEGLGAPMMADQMNTELGLSLSRSGGIGLTEFLLKAMQPADAPPASASTDVFATGPTLAPLPDAVPAAARRVVSSLNPSAVSSEYGWRPDPINGQTRFHAGQDLRVAYGREVRAATAGIVRAAGERSGYGLTVVIDHGDGLETRYAHLSSIDVRPGAAVEPGQAIARSGNSGRSTGPHLHFEVRQDGQPVDPESVAGLVPVADLESVGRH